MNPCTPAVNLSPPGAVSIDESDPSVPLKVAAVGSRSTAMPLTLSFGRSIADVSVTGSVTSKPSTHSDDSCGRVPPMRSSPSTPRTTEGSSGSDCRMRGRGSGSRFASCAVMRLPSVSIAAPDEVSTDATTVVDSVACATSSTMRLARLTGTGAGSNPSSVRLMTSSGTAVAMLNVPSDPETVELTTSWPRFTSMETPGRGKPV